MIEILQSREDYFANPALNCSVLKAFDEDPSNLLNSQSKSSAALSTGSAVDVLLFDGKDEFDKQFYVFTCPTPTASSLVLADWIITQMITGIPFTEPLCLEGIKELGLWGSIKDPAKLLAKLDLVFKDYITLSVGAQGKFILTAEQGQKVMTGASSLLRNKYTKMCYKSDDEDSPEVIYQLAIVFSYGEYTLKAMLDSVIVDHNTKTIIGTDTKTMEESPLSFRKNVVKYRYDLQAEIYLKALEALRDKFYPDYTVLSSFYFAVLSFSKVETPFVWVIDVPIFRAKYESKSFGKLNSLDVILETLRRQRVYNNFNYPLEHLEVGYMEL